MVERTVSWFLVSVVICTSAISASTQNCPELVGVWSNHPAGEVAASGDHAYVGNGTGFFIVDVSDPSLPQQRGELPFPGNVRDIEVSGDHTFVAEHSGPPGVRGLNVIDVSDPWAPAEVGIYPTFHSPYGVAVADGYAYVLDGDGGIPVLILRVVNVSTPSNPWEEGTLSFGLGYSEDIDYSNGYAYVGGGLLVVDVSDPTAPFQVVHYLPPGPTDRVSVSGSFAYLVGGAYENHDLWVIDVSDPSSPVGVGSYNFGDGKPSDIAVSGRYAYASVRNFGASSIRVIDISTPSEPVEVGFSGSGDFAGHVAVSGDLVFVASGSVGMEIYDVSACENLLLLDGFDWGDTARWSAAVP